MLMALKHDVASDACAVPVLSADEAAALAAGSSSHGGAVPCPHPKLERTPADAPLPAPADAIIPRGAHTEEILRELGLDDGAREALRREGALGTQPTLPKL